MNPDKVMERMMNAFKREQVMRKKAREFAKEWRELSGTEFAEWLAVYLDRDDDLDEFCELMTHAIERVRN